MTIYIDSDYKCYVSASDGRRAIETNDFNGKCPEWIESYRFVPEGETWTREDGEVFTNMAAPWKDLSEAYVAQTAYVTAQNTQYEAALTEIEAALEVTS
jgi:hypothetical protein|nr:MAG TPA: hypothetical protein [Caudoviricetes sp.]